MRSAAPDRATLLAEDAAGRVVARGSYARVYGPRAVLELELDEALWHRGTTMRLLRRVCSRAADDGISTLLLRASVADLRLLALLRERFASRERVDHDHVDVEIPTT